jgi:two-component system sensor histidine kinase RpfC
MESTEKNFNWYGQLNDRLRKTEDSEPEQAKLRLAIGILLVGYFCLPWAQNKSFYNVFTSFPSLVTIAYYLISLFIFLAIFINPIPSPVRRVCGALLDMVSLSIVMFHSGSESVPLFVLYLWVVLGNGFRYGIKYLYISQAISVTGFFIAIIWGAYWQQQQSFAISLFIILCLLPIYFAFLLKKLHDAIDMAKQANNAKSRFLANMSHELRTPLNGVIGMGELLRETKLNSEQKELVNTLHSSANTLLELIEKTLDIAKIEAGKITIENKDIDLHATVKSVIYMLSPMGEAKGLSVSCTIDPLTPFALKGDSQRLKQVLINLINNAIKFTKSGSVILTVFQVGGSKNNPRIRFEIEDTGIGIPEYYIAKIFDDFTQVANGSNTSLQGTGLGTTISKELVDLMGGEIGVESELNQGSTFWFELPFKSISHDDNSISNNHILLLSGEEIAAVVRPSLKGWVIDFDWVRSSTRAISQLIHATDKKYPYDTVIVDQSCLTDISPVQFAQLIKSEGLLENTSLVLINSSESMIDANKLNFYYISTLEVPEDKRVLFNALHAAKSVNFADPDIVTMAEFYAKQVDSKILNILVAEDNLVNQQVIDGILRKAGHRVNITDTGDKALDILSVDFDKIDMLILDMNMPGTSGIEVVKAIRFMDTSCSLPVLMLTADATPEAKELSIQAGANAFLTKPINSRVLLEKIAILSRKLQSSTQAKGGFQSLTKNSDNEHPRALPWFDDTVIRELSILDDDPAFIQSLVSNFCKDGGKHISTIAIAMLDDYYEFRERLHALKGSATELGANRLVSVCLKGEKYKPYDMGTEKTQLLLKELENVFAKTITSLEEAVVSNKRQKPNSSE